MARRIRVGYARVMQETNAFSPVPTTLEDFRAVQLMRGAELGRACGRRGREIPAYVKRAELSGFVEEAERDGAVEAVPLLGAWAISGGHVTREAFDTLLSGIAEEMDRAGDLDGVFLSLHGAMGVEGMRDPDTEVIRRVRSFAKKPIRVGASFDLHANLTRARVEAADVMAGYRTNPHRDHARTGARAARLLFGTVRGAIEPRVAWRSLPMILGGGTTVDLLPPVRAIFARLRELDREILSSDVFFCHFLNVDPALGYASLAYADRDDARANAVADELAERLWALRDKQLDPPLAPEEAIDRARRARFRRKTGAILFADASDAVGAGGPGDNPKLLAALLEHATDLVSYVPVRDPQAIEELWSRAEGERVELDVGAKLDPSGGPPARVRGTLRRKVTHENLKRMVHLDLGHVQLVLVEGPALAVKPSFYEAVGLSCWKADIIVAKSFISFLLYFAPLLRAAWLVKTGGSTDFDAAFRLPFDGPVIPRDSVMEWKSRDAMRRGLR